MLFLIATADYTGTTENHLSFTKGSRIEFIERTEGGFIKGKLNGKIGILPSSLITIETRPLSIFAHPKEDSSKSSGSLIFPQSQPITQTTTSLSSLSLSTTQPIEISNKDDSSTTTSNNSVTPSPTNSSISSATKEDIIVSSSSSPTTTTVQTPTTTTTTTTTTSITPNEVNDEEEEDDDSTDSENERKIIVKPSENTTSSNGSGGNIDGADLNKTSDTSFLNLRQSVQDSETRREKKKKAQGSSGETEGLFRKSKHSSTSKKRRYANRKYLPNISVSVFEDLPNEMKSDMQYEEVAIEDVKANFKIFLRVVKFITRQRFTYIHPDESNMTVTTTTTTLDDKGVAVTTTVVTTTKTVDNENPDQVVTKPREQEEIRTSTYDTDPFAIDMNLEEKDKKAKHVELKLERKRILTGTTPEFLGHASTTIKVISDIKKKIKFGDMIGKGAFGRVYEAHYEKKKVAIKVVPYGNPKQQHAVLTEIGFLGKCKHANILSYKNSVLYNSDLFIITEFLQGGTLEQAVSSPHIFKESQIGYIGKEILKGIEYLHDKKMVHRDLKSANIMISLDGEIKIIDFGLCASVEKDTHFHMVGSPYWMAPEMIRGENISYPCDIWSFGICMLELLNKKPPHRESRVKAMFTNTTKGIDFSKIKCSLDLKDMLWQCFNLNPAKRSNANKLLRHPFFKRAESKSGMKGLFDNMFLQRNLNTTGFFY